MEKIENKNIEESKGGNMNILKKIVMGISGYFKENYRDHKFRKVVSILVVMCFILNIANLPAYAGKSSRYEKKKQMEEMKSESSSQSVSYMGDETSGTVSYMQMLSDNIEVKDNVIYKKGKGGKLEAIGTWDGEKASIMDGEGKFRENSTYTEAVKTKQNKGKASETSVIKEEEDGESEIAEQVKIEKGEEKEVTSVTIGMPKEKEEDKEKTEIAKEGSITQESQKSEITKEEETEVIKETEEKEEGKNYRDSEEYKEVVTKIAQDTGLSEEEIEAQLAGVPEDKIEEAIGVLRDFYKNEEATIINCAVESLAAVLDMTSKGVLALQALLVEIATGVFGAESIKNIDGKSQLMTSMNAMNEVLKMYGMEAGGYSIGVEEFISNLQEGESGIVWVNGNHYITVTKEAEGYSISDNGKVTNYKDEASIISKLMSSYGVEKGKDIKVLTNAKEIEKKYEEKEISKEEMKDIKGAAWKTETYYVEVEKEGTRTEERTRQEQRTGTRSYTDKDGKSHTETYTYTVTVKYKVEVKYKYKVKEKREKKVWVEEPKQEEKKGVLNKIAEKIKQAEEAAKKAAEAAKAAAEAKRIAEANKKAQEAAAKAALEKETKRINNLSNKEFNEEIKNKDSKVNVTSVSIEGKEIKVKENKEVEKVLKDYDKVKYVSENVKDSKVSYDEDKGWQVTVGADTLGKDKAVTVKADEISDNQEEAEKFVVGANKAVEAAAATDSKEVGIGYDKEGGWSVKTPHGDINVDKIDDVQRFGQEYQAAAAVVNDIENATAAYNEETQGWEVTVPGVGGAEGTTIAVAEIGTNEEDINNFVDGYNTAVAVTNPDGGIEGATASYDAENGWTVKVGDETIKTSDIGTGVDASTKFIDEYKAAAAVTNAETGIPGATASYDAEKGWTVQVGEASIDVSDIGTSEAEVGKFVEDYNKAIEITTNVGSDDFSVVYDSENKNWQLTYNNGTSEETINVSEIGNSEEFITQYNAVKTAVGDSSTATVNYDSNNGWQVNAGGKTFSATDIEELGITFGTNEAGAATINIAGQEEAIQVSDITNVETFITDYRTGQEIAEQTGLGLSYDSENKNWQIEYNSGEENRVINVAEIDNKEDFISQYNEAKTVVDGIEGATYEYNEETKEWGVKVPEVEEVISVKDIENEETFVNEYNAAVTAVSGVGEGTNVQFSYDTENGLQVKVGWRTFDATDIDELGITFGTNESGATTISLEGYDQPINISDISNVETFITDYRAGQEIAEETGLVLSYDSSTKKWQMEYNDGTEDRVINVADIEDKDEFITQYNNAQTIVEAVPGTTVNYNEETKTWEVTMPKIGSYSSPVTVSVAEIGTDEEALNTFIEGYRTAEALVEVSGGGKGYYNEETNCWEVRISGLGTTQSDSTIFTIDGSDIQVKEIRNYMDQVVASAAGGSETVAQINAALAAATEEVGSSFDGDITKKVQEISINAAESLLNGEMSLSVKNFVYKTLGFSSSGGVVINETRGTMTQYNSDGSKTIIDLNYENRSENFSYDELRNMLDTEGFDRALDYAKCYGAVKTITAKDTNGEVIYTATNVGYYEGDHCIALDYAFNQDYSDEIYFTNVGAGEHKVVVENFYSQRNAEKERAMVYSVDVPENGSGTNTFTTGQLNLTLGNGATISGLDKVTEWETVRGEDGKIDYQTARTVDFVNGENAINGGEGCASGFEEATVDRYGNVVGVTRYDLAYYDTKQTGNNGGSGSGGTDIVAQYKKILTNAENLQIDGDFYDGYEKVDSAWVDMGNTTVRSYDVDSQSLTQMGVELQNGDTVSVTAANVGDDWRYNSQAVAIGSDITIQGQGSDGVSYSVNGKTTSYDWTNVGLADIDNSTALGRITVNGVDIMTANGCTFSPTNGFSGADYSDPSANFRILGNGAFVYGIQTDGTTATYVDSQLVGQSGKTTYSVNLTIPEGTAVTKDDTFSQYVNNDDIIAIRTMSNGLQVYTQNGNMYYSDNYGFGGADFSVPAENFTILNNGAMVSGIEVDGDTARYQDSQLVQQNNDTGITYFASIDYTNGSVISPDDTYEGHLTDMTAMKKMNNGVEVYTQNGITYSDSTGFSGANYSNAAENFITISNGAMISGIKVTNNVATYQDSQMIQQGKDVDDYDVTYVASLDFENGTTVTRYDSYSTHLTNMVAIREINGVQVYTQNGITYSASTGFSGANYGDSSKNFINVQRGNSNIRVTGISVVGNTATYQDSQMQGTDGSGNFYNVSLDSSINGQTISNDFEYAGYIPASSINASEDGVFWRQTGSYSDTDGFYGAQFTDQHGATYSDFFAQTSNGGIICNIKRLGKGNYVAQTDGDDVSTHTYLMSSQYNAQYGQTQQVAIGISAGTVIDEAFLQEGYKSLDMSNVVYQWPTQAQAQEIANSVKTTTETTSEWHGPFVKETITTTTTTWLEWDYETGQYIECSGTTEASEKSCLFTTYDNQVTTTTKIGDLSYTYTQNLDWCWGWHGAADTLHDFEVNGKFDIDNKYLSALGISLDRVSDGSGINNLVVRRTFRSADGVTHLVQTTYRYNGSDEDFNKTKSYTSNTTRVAVKTAVYTDIDEEIAADFDNGSFLYTATGNSTEVTLDDNGTATGVAITSENAAIINGEYAGSVVTEGAYKVFRSEEEGGDYVVNCSNAIMATHNYEKIVGEFISGLTDEQLSATMLTLTGSDGQEYTFRPYYEDGHLIYNLVGYENKNVYFSDYNGTVSDKIKEYEEQGYTVKIVSSYTDPDSGMTHYTLNIRKNDITQSEVTFSKDFEGNESPEGWSFGIDSITFDSSSGFTVSASLILDSTNAFHITGSTRVPPAGEGGGETPEPVKEERYAVSASINGDKMDLKATGEEEARVSITFGLGELRNDSVSDYTFDHFYAGTTLTFYEPSVLESVNENTRELSNSSVDVGDIVNQTIRTNVSGGSVFLDTDTRLSDLAGKVAEKGVNGGTVEVENTIEINDGGSTQFVQIRATLESGQNWESANKTVLSGTDLNNLREVQNGDSLLGGTYKGNGKIDMGGFLNWNGTIDFNKSPTEFSVDKHGFARVCEVVAGVVISVIGVIEAIFVGIVTAAISLATWTNFGDNWNAYFKEAEFSYLKLAASLIKDKQYSEITGGEAASAMFSGIAAIAAVVVAVIGIVASPFTAGASAVGGVVFAGFVIGAVIGTTVAAVGAARAAFDASENIQMYIKTGNEQYLKAGLINLGLAIFSIATAGMAAEFGNIGAGLAAQLVGKQALYAAAVAAARQGGKAAAEKVVAAYGEAYAKSVARGAAKAAARRSASLAAKYTAKTLGADVSQVVIKEAAGMGVKGALNSLRTAPLAAIKEGLKNPWVFRGALMGGSSLVDGAMSGMEQLFGINLDGTVFGGIHDISRVFSVQGMLGFSQISEDSWLNNNVFGIEGLKWSSVLWVGGYVFGPGLANGVAGFVSGCQQNGFGAQIGSMFSNVGSNLSQLGQFTHQGFNETLANIGKLFGGSGGGLTGAVQAWGSLGTNMYRMVLLNIGMGLTGSGMRRLGLVGNENSAFGQSSLGSLLNFVMGEMGVSQTGRALTIDEVFKNSFANESLANSAMFGVIMYALMPTVSGIAKGFKGVSAAEEATASGSIFSDMLDGTKGFVNSIWEEGFNEGIVQGLVTPFVGPQAAEYISEFAFPETGGNITYMNTVQNANCNTYTGAQSAAQSMTQLYASKGYGDITFEAVDLGDGNFGIVMSGMQGAANSIIQSAGANGVRAFYSGGNLNLEIASNFSGNRAQALAKAKNAIAQALNINLDSLQISEDTGIITIGQSLLGNSTNRYNISTVGTYSSGSKAGLQSIMMGAYNAMNMPGFSGNIGAILASNENFSDNQTVQNVRESFENGIVAANGITPSQVSAPGIWDAFWKGDTRTSADMLGVEINAARIVQLYGTNGHFDATKFTNQNNGLTITQQLEQLTSIVTLTQAGVNMESFITGEQLNEVLSNMIQSDTQNSGAEARMQIAKWGAFLARGGIVNSDILNTVAESIGIMSVTEEINNGTKMSTLNDFGVTTIAQARELGTYVAIIQQAAGITVLGNRGILNEVKSYNDRILNIESKLNGQSLEQQRKIIDEEMEAINSGEFIDSIITDYLNSRNNDTFEGQVRENLKTQINNLQGYNRKSVKKALQNMDSLSLTELVNLSNNLDMRQLTGMSLAEMGIKISVQDIKFNSTENNHIPRINFNGMEYSLSLADLIDAGIVTENNINVKAQENGAYMLNVNNTNGNTIMTIVVDANSLPSDFTTSDKYKAVVETIAEQVSNIEKVSKGSLDYENILSKFSMAANYDNINPLGAEASARIHTVEKGTFSGKQLQLSYFDAFVTQQGLIDFFNRKGGNIETFTQDLRKANSLEELKQSYPNSYAILEQLSTEKFMGMEAIDGIADRIVFMAENQKAINNQILTVQTNVKAFIEKNKGVTGIELLDNVHNYLMSDNFTESGLSAEQRTDWLMSFMYEYVKASSMWGLGAGSFSASQSEAISAFLAGYDIALGMGGGKTPIGTEATIIHRILFGSSASCEILVGNEDLDNFTSAKGDAKKMFDLFGLQTVQSKQFRNDDGSWNIDGLLAAYQDANTIVIMSPTDRGFLKAEAAAKGGETALKINTALNSVTNMIVDEVHKVAQNQVSTVISNGNTSPTQAEINRAIKYAQTIDYRTILNSMGDIRTEMLGRNNQNNGSELGTKITIDGQQVAVAQFRTEAEAMAYKDQNVIAIIGTGAVADRIMLLGNANELIKKSVGEDFNASEFESMVKGLFATDAVGGFADTPQGIKPVGTDGPQMSMVPSDYYIQMGVLLKRNTTNMSEIMDAFAQISKTSMSVSNKDITAGVRGVIRGMTGTAEGYEPHIQNITGSKGVYSISGENFDYRDSNLKALDFNGTREQRIETLSKQLQELIKTIDEQDSDGKVEFDNFLFLAKDASTIDIIREVVSQNYELLQQYGITVYEFTNRTGKWNGAENVTGSIETINDKLSDVAKNYTERRLVIANEFGMTGIDYQGLFNNFLLDSQLMTDSDIAQALKRNGRTVSKGYDKARWDARRFLAVDSVAASSILQNYLENGNFMDYAASENGLASFRADSSVMELFNQIRQNGANITEIVNNNKETSMKLLALLNSIQTRDSVTRFNIQDATKDFALVKPFRTMMELTSNESVRKVLEKALEEQLGNMQYDANRDLTLNEDVKGNEEFNADQVLFDIFNGNVQNAIEVFSTVLQSAEVQNDSAVKQFIEVHLAQLQNAVDTFDNLTPNAQKALASANSVEEFASILKSFTDYLAPSNNQQSLPELSTVVSNEAVQQELSSDWATQKGLVTKGEDGKLYLTQVGQNYAQLAETVANNKSGNISKVLAVILQMLLGGGASVPPEEKEQVLAIAQALNEKGITNVKGLANVVNLLSYDTEMFNVINEGVQKKEIDISDLKSVINARHPQGMDEMTLARIMLGANASEKEILAKAGEIYLPTPQSMALRWIVQTQTNKTDESLKSYDSLVEKFYQYQAQRYALTAREKVQIFMQERERSAVEFEQKHPTLSAITDIMKKIILAPVSILSSVPRFAIMGTVGKLLPFGNQQTSSMFAKAFNSFAGVSTSDILLNRDRSKDSETQKASLAEMALSLVYGIGNIHAANVNAKDLTKSVSKVSNNINSDITDMNAEEIKTAMVQAGMPITKYTDKAIATMKETKASKAGMKLSDIKTFERMEENKPVELGKAAEVAKGNIADITDKVNRVTNGKYTQEEVQGMLLESCAVSALDGITKTIPMVKMVEGLTNFAIDMVTEDSDKEGLDNLKAAGKGKKVSLGSLRNLIDYEYALVEDAKAITSPVIAYFDKNHVAQVSSKKDIEEVEAQGYKFTGLVLADKKDIAGNEGMAKEIMLNRVYGVMKAEETSEIIEYILAVYKGEDKGEQMKKYIGATGDSKEEINEAVMRKIEEVVEMGAKGELPKVIVDAQVKALTGIREILMVASEEGTDWLAKADKGQIVEKVEANRKVNQSVITKSVSTGKINNDFVINVVKLQKAVTEKGLSEKMAKVQELMKNGKTDLGAIMDIQGKEDLRMPMDLFRLSDIHAVAASA